MPYAIRQQDREGIAYRMREWRERHNMTQADAALLFGVQRAGWARYERAEVFPTGCIQALEYLLSTVPPTRTDIDEIGRRPIRVQLQRQTKLRWPAIFTRSGSNRSSGATSGR